MCTKALIAPKSSYTVCLEFTYLIIHNSVCYHVMLSSVDRIWFDDAFSFSSMIKLCFTSYVWTSYKLFIWHDLVRMGLYERESNLGFHSNDRWQIEWVIGIRWQCCLPSSHIDKQSKERFVRFVRQNQISKCELIERKQLRPKIQV